MSIGETRAQSPPLKIKDNVDLAGPSQQPDLWKVLGSYSEMFPYPLYLNLN